jgi:hypothetical protein
MSTGLGLVVIAAIFAFGVALFGLLAISLLPALTVLDEKLEARRRRRRASGGQAAG